MSNSKLSEFPVDIAKLADVLRTLNLSDNKISELPAFVGNFEQLKQLTLNNNRIAQLPVEIGHIGKLETLSLNCNRLCSLLPSFNKLNNLRTLSLSANNFSEFPLILCQLRNLEVLDLSRNKICNLPDGVQQLNAVEVNLNQNQMSAISEDIVECPRLKILRLEENCLNLTAFSPKILKESSLTLLAVDGNLFEMKSLHQLEGYDAYMERYTATKKKMF